MHRASQAPLSRREAQGRALAGDPGERHTGPWLGFAAGSAEKAPYEVGRRGGETSAHVEVWTA